MKADQLNVHRLISLCRHSALDIIVRVALVGLMKGLVQERQALERHASNSRIVFPGTSSFLGTTTGFSSSSCRVLPHLRHAHVS